VAAMRRRSEITNSVEALFNEVSLILLPAMPVPSPERSAETITIAGREVDFTLALVRYTCLFDHTGHPALAMPVESGRAGDGASVQVIGPLGRDGELLNFA